VVTVHVKITPYRWPLNPLTVGKDKILGDGSEQLKACMEKYKSRLSSWNACCHSVQKLCLWNYCFNLQNCYCACSATRGCTHCPPQVHLYQFIACYMFRLLWATIVRELKITQWCFQYSTVEWLLTFHNSTNMQQSKNWYKCGCDWSSYITVGCHS
jgi:hypothetical protein